MMTDTEKRATERALAFKDYQAARTDLELALDDHSEAHRTEVSASNALNDAKKKHKEAKARLEQLLTD